MILAGILAVIFVPLLFILGIRTGMEQSDNKWIKIMKESTSGNHSTIEKLQNQMKKKNEEIIKFKETKKSGDEAVEALKEELVTSLSEENELKLQVTNLEKKICVYKGGLVMDDIGVYHCPIIYNDN